MRKSSHILDLSLAFCFLVSLSVFLTACLVSSPEKSGGLAAITVVNTSLSDVVEAANQAFTNAGYTQGPVDYPDSFSYDKPSGAFGQVMWGSYHDPSSYRAVLKVNSLGDNSYRLSAHARIVSDSGDAGFESSRPMIGPWNLELMPVLRNIKKQTDNSL
ncbi:MAG: hypothetical protein ACK5NG_10650 [Chthoniobacterales bacterium]